MGRPSAQASLRAFLDAVTEAPATLVFEGEAGIGKTTLLNDATKVARERGFRVLSTRPSPAESVLAYTAVADLLDGVGQHALDRILSRRPSDGAAVEQRVVAAGFRSAIQALSEDEPLVIAIDDLQWLDPSSEWVISFAMRRADGPLGVLGALRTGERPGASSWLQMLQPGAVDGVTVPTMTLGAMHAMIAERLGRTFPRSTMLRVQELSAGNPFYALEFARALVGDTLTDASALPPSLTELVRTRLEQLDVAGNAALLATACMAAPTLDLIARATDTTPDGVVAALEDAEAGDFVTIGGNRVAFTHPLLAHGVYGAASPGRRRRMHRRLSAIIDEPEVAARHLALSSVGSDARTLETLDWAAESARQRGAPSAAAELLRLAIELGGNSAGRRIRLASHHFDAGDTATARTLLVDTLAELAPGPERAAALHMLAVVHLADDSFPEAAECFELALTYDSVDLAQRVDMLSTLAWVLLQSGQLEDAVERIEAAVPHAERLGQPYPLSQVLSFRAVLHFMRGDGLDEANLSRALDLHDGSDYGLITIHPDMQNALLLTWTGELARAHAEMASIRSRCVEQGGESELIFVCFHSMLLEIWRGDFAVAAFEAEDIMERAQLLGSDVSLAVALVMRSAIAGHAGDVEQARRDAGEALAVATRAGANLVVLWQFIVLGFVEVSAGDYDAALIAFEIPRAVLAEAPRATEVIVASFVPDAVEALIHRGRLDEAEVLVELLEANGERLDRAWMLAVGARSRAMLLAARGDVEAALSAARQAIAEHDRLPMPFDRARTELLLGQLERRRRHKEAATATLKSALATFEDLGIPLWADRARAELDRNRTGPRRGTVLTPSEQRVAELAATGMTNRDVASALFISPKTVEVNLARVYHKLDIKSRAELGRRIATLET